jgi:ADP-ribose pyrophosphatase
MEPELLTTFRAPPVVERERVFDSPYFRIERQTVEMPSGSRATFYLRQEPDVAVCLPVTPDGRFVVLEEYRHGPGRSLFEVPGGTVDEGEDPLAAAARETLEESGYRGQVTHLASTWISAYSTARKHIYLMRDATQETAPIVSDSEMSRVLLLSRSAFETVLASGELTDLDCGLLCLRTWDSLQKENTK